MTSAIPRPFRVLGIQQIAIGGPDKTRLQKLWVDMLGLEVTGTFRSERENVDEDICAIGTGPFKVEVDLMQPLDPEKKPAVHATPLNHVGLWIDDLPTAVEWLTSQGCASRPAASARARRASTSAFASEGERRVPDRGRGRADRDGAGAARGGEGLRRARRALSPGAFRRSRPRGSAASRPSGAAAASAGARVPGSG